LARFFRHDSVESNGTVGMAHREFTDSKRITWAVWDVYPSLGDRRAMPGDRREYMRETLDRRTAFNPARVSPEFALGWLAFQAGEERRRLAPVPVGWHELAPEQLEQLCQAAMPVGRLRRALH
jgi:hypothetical protein